MNEKLRVYAIRNGIRTNYSVQSAEQAKKIITEMAHFDLLSDDVDWNDFGLQIGNNGDWEEWVDEDGENIMEIRMRELYNEK